MKKTKKEKMLADLRKKIAAVDIKTRFMTHNQSMAPSVVKTDNKHLPISFERQSKQLSIDYVQISRDLKKTLSISVLIISILFISKFLLRL